MYTIGNAKIWDKRSLVLPGQARGRVSRRFAATRYLLQKHSEELNSYNSKNLAQFVKRYIQDTPLHQRVTSRFVKEIIRKVHFVHEYNVEVYKFKGKYPRSRNLEQLLVRYVELEMEVLYKEEYYNKKYENIVEQRILHLLLRIYYDSIKNSDLPPKTITEESGKAVVKLFTNISPEHRAKYKLINCMFDKVLDKIGLLQEVNQLKGQDIPLPFDTRLRCPKVMKLNNLLTSDYGTDDDSSDSDSDSDIFQDTDHLLPSKINDVLFNINGNHLESPESMIKEEIVAIDDDDDDPTEEPCEKKVPLHSTNKILQIEILEDEDKGEDIEFVSWENDTFPKREKKITTVSSYIVLSSDSEDDHEPSSNISGFVNCDSDSGTSLNSIENRDIKCDNFPFSIKKSTSKNKNINSANSSTFHVASAHISKDSRKSLDADCRIETAQNVEPTMTCEKDVFLNRNNEPSTTTKSALFQQSNNFVDVNRSTQNLTKSPRTTLLDTKMTSNTNEIGIHGFNVVNSDNPIRKNKHLELSSALHNSKSLNSVETSSTTSDLKIETSNLKNNSNLNQFSTENTQSISILNEKVGSSEKQLAKTSDVPLVIKSEMTRSSEKQLTKTLSDVPLVTKSSNSCCNKLISNPINTKTNKMVESSEIQLLAKSLSEVTLVTKSEIMEFSEKHLTKTLSDVPLVTKGCNSACNTLISNPFNTITNKMVESSEKQLAKTNVSCNMLVTNSINAKTTEMVRSSEKHLENPSLDVPLVAKSDMGSSEKQLTKTLSDVSLVTNNSNSCNTLITNFINTKTSSTRSKLYEFEDEKFRRIFGIEPDTKSRTNNSLQQDIKKLEENAESNQPDNSKDYLIDSLLAEQTTKENVDENIKNISTQSIQNVINDNLPITVEEIVSENSTVSKHKQHNKEIDKTNELVKNEKSSFLKCPRNQTTEVDESSKDIDCGTQPVDTTNVIVKTCESDKDKQITTDNLKENNVEQTMAELSSLLESTSNTQKFDDIVIREERPITKNTIGNNTDTDIFENVSENSEQSFQGIGQVLENAEIVVESSEIVLKNDNLDKPVNVASEVIKAKKQIKRQKDSCEVGEHLKNQLQPTNEKKLLITDKTVDKYQAEQPSELLINKTILQQPPVDDTNTNYDLPTKDNANYSNFQSDLIKEAQEKENHLLFSNLSPTKNKMDKIYQTNETTSLEPEKSQKPIEYNTRSASSRRKSINQKKLMITNKKRKDDYDYSRNQNSSVKICHDGAEDVLENPNLNESVIYNKHILTNEQEFCEASSSDSKLPCKTEEVNITADENMSLYALHALANLAVNTPKLETNQISEKKHTFNTSVLQASHNTTKVVLKKNHKNNKNNNTKRVESKYITRNSKRSQQLTKVIQERSVVNQEIVPDKQEICTSDFIPDDFMKAINSCSEIPTNKTYFDKVVEVQVLSEESNNEEGDLLIDESWPEKQTEIILGQISPVYDQDTVGDDFELIITEDMTPVCISIAESEHYGEELDILNVLSGSLKASPTAQRPTISPKRKTRGRPKKINNKITKLKKPSPRTNKLNSRELRKSLCFNEHINTFYDSRIDNLKKGRKTSKTTSSQIQIPEVTSLENPPNNPEILQNVAVTKSKRISQRRKSVLNTAPIMLTNKSEETVINSLNDDNNAGIPLVTFSADMEVVKEFLIVEQNSQLPPTEIPILTFEVVPQSQLEIEAIDNFEDSTIIIDNENNADVKTPLISNTITTHSESSLTDESVVNLETPHISITDGNSASANIQISQSTKEVDLTLKEDIVPTTKQSKEMAIVETGSKDATVVENQNDTNLKETVDPIVRKTKFKTKALVKFYEKSALSPYVSLEKLNPLIMKKRYDKWIQKNNKDSSENNENNIPTNNKNETSEEENSFKVSKKDTVEHILEEGEIKIENEQKHNINKSEKNKSDKHINILENILIKPQVISLEASESINSISDNKEISAEHLKTSITSTVEGVTFGTVTEESIINSLSYEVCQAKVIFVQDELNDFQVLEKFNELKERTTTIHIDKSVKIKTINKIDIPKEIVPKHWSSDFCNEQSKTPEISCKNILEHPQEPSEKSLKDDITKKDKSTSRTSPRIAEDKINLINEPLNFESQITETNKVDKKGATKNYENSESIEFSDQVLDNMQENIHTKKSSEQAIVVNHEQTSTTKDVSDQSLNKQADLPKKSSYKLPPLKDSDMLLVEELPSSRIKLDLLNKVTEFAIVEGRNIVIEDPTIEDKYIQDSIINQKRKKDEPKRRKSSIDSSLLDRDNVKSKFTDDIHQRNEEKIKTRRKSVIVEPSGYDTSLQNNIDLVIRNVETKSDEQHKNTERVNSEMLINAHSNLPNVKEKIKKSNSQDTFINNLNSRKETVLNREILKIPFMEKITKIITDLSTNEKPYGNEQSKQEVSSVEVTLANIKTVESKSPLKVDYHNKIEECTDSINKKPIKSPKSTEEMNLTGIKTAESQSPSKVEYHSKTGECSGYKRNKTSKSPKPTEEVNLTDLKAAEYKSPSKVEYHTIIGESTDSINKTGINFLKSTEDVNLPGIKTTESTSPSKIEYHTKTGGCTDSRNKVPIKSPKATEVQPSNISQVTMFPKTNEETSNNTKLNSNMIEVNNEFKESTSFKVCKDRVKTKPDHIIENILKLDTQKTEKNIGKIIVDGAPKIKNNTDSKSKIEKLEVKKDLTPTKKTEVIEEKIKHVKNTSDNKSVDDTKLTKEEHKDTAFEKKEYKHRRERRKLSERQEKDKLSEGSSYNKIKNKYSSSSRHNSHSKRKDEKYIRENSSHLDRKSKCFTPDPREPPRDKYHNHSRRSSSCIPDLAETERASRSRDPKYFDRSSEKHRQTQNEPKSHNRQKNENKAITNSKRTSDKDYRSEKRDNYNQCSKQQKSVEEQKSYQRSNYENESAKLKIPKINFKSNNTNVKTSEKLADVQLVKNVTTKSTEKLHKENTMRSDKKSSELKNNITLCRNENLLDKSRKTISDITEKEVTSEEGKTSRPDKTKLSKKEINKEGKIEITDSVKGLKPLQSSTKNHKYNCAEKELQHSSEKTFKTKLKNDSAQHSKVQNEINSTIHKSLIPENKLSVGLKDKLLPKKENQEKEYTSKDINIKKENDNIKEDYSKTSSEKIVKTRTKRRNSLSSRVDDNIYHNKVSQPTGKYDLRKVKVDTTSNIKNEIETQEELRSSKAHKQLNKFDENLISKNINSIAEDTTSNIGNKISAITETHKELRSSEADEQSNNKFDENFITKDVISMTEVCSDTKRHAVVSQTPSGTKLAGNIMPEENVSPYQNNQINKQPTGKHNSRKVKVDTTSNIKNEIAANIETQKELRSSEAHKQLNEFDENLISKNINSITEDTTSNIGNKISTITKTQEEISSSEAGEQSNNKFDGNLITKNVNSITEVCSDTKRHAVVSQTPSATKLAVHIIPEENVLPHQNNQINIQPTRKYDLRKVKVDTTSNIKNEIAANIETQEELESSEAVEQSNNEFDETLITENVNGITEVCSDTKRQADVSQTPSGAKLAVHIIPEENVSPHQINKSEEKVLKQTESNVSTPIKHNNPHIIQELTPTIKNLAIINKLNKEIESMGKEKDCTLNIQDRKRKLSNEEETLYKKCKLDVDYFIDHSISETPHKKQNTNKNEKRKNSNDISNKKVELIPITDTINKVKKSLFEQKCDDEFNTYTQGIDTLENSTITSTISHENIENIISPAPAYIEETIITDSFHFVESTSECDENGSLTEHSTINTHFDLDNFINSEEISYCDSVPAMEITPVCTSKKVSKFDCINSTVTNISTSTTQLNPVTSPTMNNDNKQPEYYPIENNTTSHEVITGSPICMETRQSEDISVSNCPMTKLSPNGTNISVDDSDIKQEDGDTSVASVGGPLIGDPWTGSLDFTEMIISDTFSESQDRDTLSDCLMESLDNLYSELRKTSQNNSSSDANNIVMNMGLEDTETNDYQTSSTTLNDITYYLNPTANERLLDTTPEKMSINVLSNYMPGGNTSDDIQKVIVEPVEQFLPSEINNKINTNQNYFNDIHFDTSSEKMKNEDTSEMKINIKTTPVNEKTVTHTDVLQRENINSSEINTNQSYFNDIHFDTSSEKIKNDDTSEMKINIKTTPVNEKTVTHTDVLQGENINSSEMKKTIKSTPVKPLRNGKGSRLPSVKYEIYPIRTHSRTKYSPLKNTKTQLIKDDIKTTEKMFNKRTVVNSKEAKEDIDLIIPQLRAKKSGQTLLKPDKPESLAKNSPKQHSDDVPLVNTVQTPPVLPKNSISQMQNSVDYSGGAFDTVKTNKRACANKGINYFIDNILHGDFEQTNSKKSKSRETRADKTLPNTNCVTTEKSKSECNVGVKRAAETTLENIPKEKLRKIYEENLDKEFNRLKEQTNSKKYKFRETHADKALPNTNCDTSEKSKSQRNTGVKQPIEIPLESLPKEKLHKIYEETLNKEFNKLKEQNNSKKIKSRADKTLPNTNCDTTEKTRSEYNVGVKPTIEDPLENVNKEKLLKIHEQNLNEEFNRLKGKGTTNECIKMKKHTKSNQDFVRSPSHKHQNSVPSSPGVCRIDRLSSTVTASAQEFRYSSESYREYQGPPRKINSSSRPSSRESDYLRYREHSSRDSREHTGYSVEHHYKSSITTRNRNHFMQSAPASHTSYDKKYPLVGHVSSYKYSSSTKSSTPFYEDQFKNKLPIPIPDKISQNDYEWHDIINTKFRMNVPTVFDPPKLHMTSLDHQSKQSKTNKQTYG